MIARAAVDGLEEARVDALGLTILERKKESVTDRTNEPLGFRIKHVEAVPTSYLTHDDLLEYFSLTGRFDELNITYCIEEATLEENDRFNDSDDPGWSDTARSELLRQVKQRWWDRAWVRQECALSKHCPSLDSRDVNAWQGLPRKVRSTGLNPFPRLSC